VEGRYVTFVNPQPSKGLLWFARIAYELQQRRPDIPLLVVEGRGKASWLAASDLDLRGLSNVHRLANTPDPRHFYQISRLVLMPSLVPETFGRVAAEAMINGIPVLASNRGGLSEALAGAGFLLDIPPSYTPQSRQTPSAEEVAPWLELIERLWNDTPFYEAERERCRQAAEVWRPERLWPRFAEFFQGVWGSRVGEVATSPQTPAHR
jgi:glycosyltransferase involved in cell wall biosynthesis